MSYNWYPPFIWSFGWLKGLPKDLYVELLFFMAEHWKGLSSHLQNALLLKYVSSSNNADLASVSKAPVHTIIYL